MNSVLHYWPELYEVCFYLGGIGLLLSVLFGYVFNLAGVDSDVDIDLDLDGDIDVDGPVGSLVSPFKPVMFLCLAGVFGAMGQYLLGKGYNTIVTFVLAFLSGLVACAILYFALLVPMAKSAISSAALSVDKMVGLKGNVTLEITKDKVGTITFATKNGLCSNPAKSMDQQTIEEGELVEITGLADGIFLVRKQS